MYIFKLKLISDFQLLQYVVSAVSPSVTHVQEGDILRAVNQQTSRLESYCRSDDAISKDEWELIIERQRQAPSTSLTNRTQPLGCSTESLPNICSNTDDRTFSVRTDNTDSLSFSIYSGW